MSLFDVPFIFISNLGPRESRQRWIGSTARAYRTSTESTAVIEMMTKAQLALAKGMPVFMNR
jgi:hypothetical protein